MYGLVKAPVSDWSWMIAHGTAIFKLTCCNLQSVMSQVSSFTENYLWIPLSQIANCQNRAILIEFITTLGIGRSYINIYLTFSIDDLDKQRTFATDNPL
jgi:hypothetical protein